jgi:hypothetical protein
VAAWACLALPLWGAAQFKAWGALALFAAILVCVLLDRKHRAPWDLATGTVLIHEAEASIAQEIPVRS